MVYSQGGKLYPALCSVLVQYAKAKDLVRAAEM